MNAVERMRVPVSSSMSAAFRNRDMDRLPAYTRKHDSLQSVCRGCSYFVRFRPPSLLISQIVPTAAHTATGQLRFLHPVRTCFVASARTGHASRPNTGNWWRRDFHPARFAALSVAPPCLRFTASLTVAAQDSGPSGSLVLSRKNYAFSASDRFSPAR